MIYTPEATMKAAQMVGIILALLLLGTAVNAQEFTLVFRQMTPEAALKLAQNVLVACQRAGYQVTVAVSDRAGVVQILLRDRFAGPHTIDVATNKAWTAASFRQDTLALARNTADTLNGGQRHFQRFVAVGGGVPITAKGALIGALGVSGAPGGEADDQCARAGLAPTQEELDF